MAEVLFIYRLAFFVLFVWGNLITCQEQKLRMLNLVYRHGDRSPAAFFPSNEHKNFWPQGPGQLTQVGMLQEFELGRFLKERYVNSTKLLNATYLRSQVYCRSSDRDRCIVSAQTQLNGLYPPHGQQVWRPKVNWQPIPVHTVPVKDDYLLRPLDYDCPRYHDLKHQSHKDQEYKKVEAENKGFLKRLSTFSGMNVTLENMWILNDVFHCEKQHNLSLPSWANETVTERLKTLSSRTFGWLFDSEEKARILGGPLLGEMVEHMKSFRDGKDALKDVYIYSAHDTTLIALLSALKLYDGVPPPYSSAVMLELYSTDDRKNLSVHIHYRFGQSNEPRHLNLQNCEHHCPLETFLKETADMIPTNIDVECGRSTAPGNICVKTVIYRSFLAAFIVVTVLFVFLIVCLCVRCRIRQAKQHRTLIGVRGGLLKDARLLDNSDYDSEA